MSCWLPIAVVYLKCFESRILVEMCIFECQDYQSWNRKKTAGSKYLYQCVQLMFLQCFVCIPARCSISLVVNYPITFFMQMGEGDALAARGTGESCHRLWVEAGGPRGRAGTETVFNF